MAAKYPTRHKPVYGNIEVLHPEGFLMFCASDKKAQWYLSRGLAIIVRDDPPAIQLTFIPKGVGRKLEKHSLVYKKNICVACGHSVVEEMNRHHIIPYCYRKSFPESIKDFNDYDVVCICFDCHEIYEKYAMQLKKELGVEYNAPLDIEYNWTEEERRGLQASKAALALLNHRDKIPASRVNELEEIVRLHLKAEPTSENIKALAATHPRAVKVNREDLHGHKVAKKILESSESLNRFFRLWRNHFLKTMKPKFMPADWHADLPIRYPENPVV